MTDGSALASVLRRAATLLGFAPGRGSRSVTTTTAAACVPIAALVGLVVLAAAFPPPAPASAPGGQPGYSAADDRNADVAAFELEKGAAPGLSAAPLFELPCHLRSQAAPDPAPSRAPVATRDRSPPVH